MKKITSLLLSALLALGALPFASACGESDSTSSPNSPPDASTLSFLRAEGTQVVNEENQPVYLRGTNAGGWGAIEQWMSGFSKSYNDEIPIRCIDHYTTSQVFIERFGKEKAKELWKTYQENYWTEEDFQTCAEMGMTAIRLPFTYMNVDFDAISSLDDAGKNYDFSALDSFIEKAAEYGMYTILDMHGAYGSQNGKDHSGQVFGASKVDFYSNRQKQALTVNLWKAIAERYKDNPNVAGYDILNEPAETTGSGTLTTEKRHWDVFDLIYDGIREVDQKHIIIIESCWEGYHLPKPTLYGWENVMYSFHHYTGTDDYYSHTTSWNSKIDEIMSNDFNVPLHMGEFTCYSNPESWEYCLNLMNAQSWHWNSWTYKVNATNVMPWGIYNVTVKSADKINAHEDSEEEIITKFQATRTEEGSPFRFRNQTTLFSIFEKYCSTPDPVVIKDTPYWIRNIEYNAIDADPTLIAGQSVPTYGEGKRDGYTVTFVPNKEDNSFYLKMQGKYFYVVESGDVSYVSLVNRQAKESRFFIIPAENGYKLLSYSTRKFLRFNQEKGYFYADTNFDDGELFLLEGV